MDQRKTRDLMKEQLELVKTEKELKEMIAKINLSLNQLLVSKNYLFKQVWNKNLSKNLS